MDPLGDCPRMYPLKSQKVSKYDIPSRKSKGHSGLWNCTPKDIWHQLAPGPDEYQSSQEKMIKKVICLPHLVRRFQDHVQHGTNVVNQMTPIKIVTTNACREERQKKIADYRVCTNFLASRKTCIKSCCARTKQTFHNYKRL